MAGPVKEMPNLKHIALIFILGSLASASEPVWVHAKAAAGFINKDIDPEEFWTEIDVRNTGSHDEKTTVAMTGRRPSSGLTRLRAATKSRSRSKMA